MSRYSEEQIFNYLDQKLSKQELEAFEQAMSNDPELKAEVEQMKVAHTVFGHNTLENAPKGISSDIMDEIKSLESKSYYRPTGLFSNTGFLLISGAFTALVAFLSLINSGVIEIPSLPESVSQFPLLGTLLSKTVITNSMLVVYGILTLALLDRFVLNPLFRRRIKSVSY